MDALRRQGSFSGMAISRLEIVLGGSVFLCCMAVLALSWRWPLVGDIASIHYLVLLMQHGMAPYRDIVDAQMPGTYLLEWAAMHVFGWSAFGARLYDWTILLVAGLAAIAIAGPYSRFAGPFAAGMLVVLHIRDGLEQTAERDLTMAALLLASYAFAFACARRRSPWMAFCAGLFASTSATLKPTVLPFAVVLMVLLWIHLRRSRVAISKYVASGLAGLLLPGAACLVFLLRERAFAAFLDAVRGMWPYYAQLDRQPFSSLAFRSVSPLSSVLVLWLLLLAAKWRRRRGMGAASWERVALAAGLLMGFASYLWQGKGFPYHRYPLMAFLLLLTTLDFVAALRGRGLLRYLGLAGLATGALVLAPLSVAQVSRFQWRDEGAVPALRAELERLGGPRLAGGVQCLDAFGGCINALYQERLPQSTGFLVDFYFFAQRQTAFTEEMRCRFWEQIERDPPAVFVVSEQSYPGPNTYGKLNRWPLFADFLSRNYALVDQYRPVHPVAWTRDPQWPFGFRVYVRDGFSAVRASAGVQSP
jgi:hypothetical protein